MNYENPHIPEGINTTKEHPLKEFSILLIGSVVLIVTLSIVLAIGGGWLASKIPFSTENKIAAMYDIDNDVDDRNSPELTQYLQNLTDRISEAQNLPEDMKITAHYIDSDTVNAFATLGGNVVFFTGLLNAIPDENTLAMIMAHEIAHIKLRHPLRALGRGVVVGIAVVTMAGVAGNDIVAKLIGDTGLLTTLNFSRDQESAADKLAVEALVKRYGHANGSVQLFKILNQQQGESGDKVPEFFTTHPLNQNRIAATQKYAQQNNWSTEGNTHKIPSAVKDELHRLRRELSDKTEQEKS